MSRNRKPKKEKPKVPEYTQEELDAMSAEDRAKAEALTAETGGDAPAADEEVSVRAAIVAHSYDAAVHEASLRQLKDPDWYHVEGAGDFEEVPTHTVYFAQGWGQHPDAANIQRAAIRAGLAR